MPQTEAKNTTKHSNQCYGEHPSVRKVWSTSSQWGTLSVCLLGTIQLTASVDPRTRRLLAAFQTLFCFVCLFRSQTPTGPPLQRREMRSVLQCQTCFFFPSFGRPNTRASKVCRFVRDFCFAIGVFSGFLTSPAAICQCGELFLHRVLEICFVYVFAFAQMFLLLDDL